MTYVIRKSYSNLILFIASINFRYCKWSLFFTFVGLMWGNIEYDLWWGFESMVGAFRFFLFLPPALMALLVMESLSLFVLVAIAVAGALTELETRKLSVTLICWPWYWILKFQGLFVRLNGFVRLKSADIVLFCPLNT